MSAGAYIDWSNVGLDVGLEAGTLTFTRVAADVPEPATWAMMLLGFGAIGGEMRYRRRKVRISYAAA
jgi:hypothetical protein